MPTRCNKWFLFQILLFAQHVSGTTMPIIRSSRVLYRWFSVVFGALVFKLSAWCWAEGYLSGLSAAAANWTCNPHLQTIPKTCGLLQQTRWASNKICNKHHLLHLIGILFPHINEDAWSKSHQIHSHYIRLTKAQSWKITIYWSVESNRPWLVSGR
jgi:hypothetical protein